MPNITYPNQRMINIHRERATTDFLGIKNDNWMAAARDLSPYALKLYLYLAANADNYTLALSPAALRQSIGMARTTYHDQFMILVDKGYLVQSGGNTYDFYEVPQPRYDTQHIEYVAAPVYDWSADEQPTEQAVQVVPPEKIEINNSQTEITINMEERRADKLFPDNWDCFTDDPSEIIMPITEHTEILPQTTSTEKFVF